MSLAITELPWLLPPPGDVSSRIRALNAATVGLGAEIGQLATFRLKAPQSASLGRVIRRSLDAGVKLEPLSPMRLGVLASSTFDLVVDALPAAAARHGVAVTIATTPYDQVMQQALDTASIINQPGLDVILLAIDHRWLGIDVSGALDNPAAAVEDAFGRVVSVVEGIRRSSGHDVIVPTIPMPPLSLFGSYDRQIAGSMRRLLEAVNGRIAGLADQPGIYLLDLAALAEQVGTATWFDPVQWGAYKFAFSSSVDSLYADHVGRLLGAIRGKARKCLVLDLDNTLWGGVIGDDGIDHIKLGQGSALGEAFLAVQRLALTLRDRGVILAVASKNDDATAREPFKTHVEMLLREHHIAVFQANWLDKASNLEAIARTLNIGIDSLVFLDDNAAERAQLRAALPMVAVPELPADPSWYAPILAAAGYFESVSFSAEDRARADSYAAEARRAEVRSSTRDLGDYLSSLGMTFTASAFDVQGRQRITQLIGKTNQFNLTTRRYSESEVSRMMEDPSVFTLQVRLGDRFGDFGMIGVVICKPLPDAAADTWVIDTWLMSCRVLGRKVEEGMLATVIAAARAAGVSRLQGVYIPTAKNGMVAEHFPKLGFTKTAPEPDGTRLFGLDLREHRDSPLPFAIG